MTAFFDTLYNTSNGQAELSPVAFLDLLFLRFWNNGIEYLIDVFRLTDHYFYDDIHKPEELVGDLGVIA